MITSSGCKDIGIGRFEFVAKTHITIQTKTFIIKYVNNPFKVAPTAPLVLFNLPAVMILTFSQSPS